MEGSGSARNTPFIVVEGHNDMSPVAGGGDPRISDDIPLFHGIEIPEPDAPSRPGKEVEGIREVSEGKTDLQLHKDQVAANPFEAHQAPVGHPEAVHNDDVYAEYVGPSPRHGSPAQAPLDNTTTPAAVQMRRNRLPQPPPTLRRATSSMREGLKNASVRVAHAGEQMGKAWNKTLDSAMIVCVICGALAILLIALALSIHSWRYQRLSYLDDNGRNVSRVDLGLQKLQRIQTLERKDDAGLVMLYDKPFIYDDVMSSAYCMRDEPIAEGMAAEEEQSSATLEGQRAAKASMWRLLQVTVKDERPKRKGPLANPPPHSVTVGRDPQAPGSLEPQYVEMREILLGSTVFDVHCKDLGRFKESGALFMRMMVAYFVAAGIGMLGAICALVLAPRTSPWCTYMKRMPINLLGSLAWIVALVVQLSALAAWGVGTDVPACVTLEGGASVCKLGPGVALTVASLVLTVLATLSFCVFFTHTFIKDLGLEKEKEQKLRQLSERRNHSSEPVPSVIAEQEPSAYPGDEVQATATRDRFLAGQAMAGAPLHEGTFEGPRQEALGRGPHAPVLGETDSPVRSVTEDSHLTKRDPIRVPNA
ncbi:hypothetical protein ACSSS7_001005 [Eimeria intestinalis]